MAPIGASVLSELAICCLYGVCWWGGDCFGPFLAFSSPSPLLSLVVVGKAPCWGEQCCPWQEGEQPLPTQDHRKHTTACGAATAPALGLAQESHCLPPKHLKSCNSQYGFHRWEERRDPVKYSSPRGSCIPETCFMRLYARSSLEHGACLKDLYTCLRPHKALQGILQVWDTQAWVGRPHQVMKGPSVQRGRGLPICLWGESQMVRHST